MSFWDEINPEQDLPGDLRELYEELGLEGVRYLVEQWGGTQLYIHSPDSVEKGWRDRQIRERWNGRNEGSLAKELGVSRRYVHRLLSAPKTRVPDPRQGDMFGSAAVTPEARPNVE